MEKREREGEKMGNTVRGNRKQKEIKVVVRFTEGYEKRFTEACLDVLRKREALNGVQAGELAGGA